MPEQKQIKVKVPEKILPGVYSNQMVVSHTREEFVLDFANLFPPEGIVNARVIVSPGHLKRLVRALSDNLARYENKFGQVMEATPPDDDSLKN